MIFFFSAAAKPTALVNSGIGGYINGFTSYFQYDDLLASMSVVYQFLHLWHLDDNDNDLSTVDVPDHLHTVPSKAEGEWIWGCDDDLSEQWNLGHWEKKWPYLGCAIQMAELVHATGICSHGGSLSRWLTVIKDLSLIFSPNFESSQKTWLNST